MKNSTKRFTGTDLGSNTFKKRYNIKYAYLSGAMYKAISNEALVIRMAQAGLMGFFGSAGLELRKIEEGICTVQESLANGESYGVNLLSTPDNLRLENSIVDIFLRHNVKNVEASAFVQVTPAIVRYLVSGLRRGSDGVVRSDNKIIAKLSRPEVAISFLNPAPEDVIEELLASNQISQEQAKMAREVPIASDICVEADSAGHTDMGIGITLLPTIQRIRDEVCASRGYKQTVHIGVAGGIGTPTAVASMFTLGADFILTGSINQCTIEAGTSKCVKDMLQAINVQHTAYAPAGDMFEIGARVQVLTLGTLFSVRANKLYDLWRQCDSIEEIDSRTKKQIQEKYFRRSFDDVYDETKAYYMRVAPKEIDKAEVNSKHKMALIFRWYFVHCSRLAKTGDERDRANYQIHTGPAMGAFNQWVQGTELQNWQNRHVDEIGTKLMNEAGSYLGVYFSSLMQAGA